MPSWNEILAETERQANSNEAVRLKYLRRLQKVTQRNVVAYYSGFLQHPSAYCGIDDDDMNSLMSVFYKLDRTKGLDLILHTPGGEIAATEAIVTYIQKMFGNNYRVIVPQLAMSAGTMISLSASSVLMGKHSSLGPIDPQVNGKPALAILEVWDEAVQAFETQAPSVSLLANQVLKFDPTLIATCKKAIQWSEQLVEDWLKTNMLAGDPNQQIKLAQILKTFGDHSNTKNHSRHIDADKARAVGVNVLMLEHDQALQDAVLSVHHIFMQTLNHRIPKIVQNHKGIAVVKHLVAG